MFSEEETKMRISTMIVFTVVTLIVGWCVLSSGVRVLEQEMNAKNASYAEAMK